MTKITTTQSSSPRYPIPSDQWDLPVSFDAAGKPVTLRQYMAPGHGDALSLSSLSPEMLADLTVQRIEAQKAFELAMIGAGMVDKTRAVREVKAQSDVGRLLTEIEQRVIRRLIDAAAVAGGL